MKGSEGIELGPEDKKLLHLLEIRLYDLSQNVEIMGKQLSNNQIKDIVSQSYNISNQLKNLFEKVGVGFLYSFFRKMQVNTVLLCTILTERLDKPVNNDSICKCQLDLSTPNKAANKANKEVLPSGVENFNWPLLGGVNLYNQTYRRGIDSLENVEIDDQLKTNKRNAKANKDSKEQFITAIMTQIENKAEVEVQSMQDQIASYILNFKESTKVANFFSCENQLQEIIDFFKLSQLQAINFLSKSPNNNNQYTEDYINRLNEMENQIKVKQTTEKGTMIEKMTYFIGKLKLKMSQIESQYEEKLAKLLQYQRSLKKQTFCEGTQTIDNYDRKLKQLQFQLKEQEERYVILNQLRDADNRFEEQIHSLNQLLQIKANQHKKLYHAKMQLEEELIAVKKVLRDKNEKLSMNTESEKRRAVKAKRLLMRGQDQLNQQLVPPQVMNRLKKVQSLSNDKRTSRHQRFSKKYDRTSFYPSVNGPRTSFQAEKFSICEEDRAEDEITKGYILYSDQMQQNNPSTRQIDKTAKDGEENNRFSGFRAESKKLTSQSKKIAEDQKQVSFKAVKKGLETSHHISDTQGDQGINIIQKINEKSRSMISIDHEGSTKRSRKNLLKQKIDSCPQSMKDLQFQDVGKESKSTSKKYIIFKDVQPQKSQISSMMKIMPFSVSEQVSIHIKPQAEYVLVRKSANQKMKRFERPSILNAVENYQKKKVQKNLKNDESQTKLKKQMNKTHDFRKKEGQNKQKGALQQNQTIKSIYSIEQEKHKQTHSKNNISLKKIDHFKGQKTYQNSPDRTKVSDNKISLVSSKKLLKQDANRFQNCGSIKRKEQKIPSIKCRESYTANQIEILAKIMNRMGTDSKKQSVMLKSQSNSKLEPNFRHIEECLDMLRRQSSGGILPGELLKQLGSNVTSEGQGLPIALIQQHLEKEELNIEQLEEILQIVQLSTDPEQYKTIASAGESNLLAVPDHQKSGLQGVHNKKKASISTKQNDINGKDAKIEGNSRIKCSESGYQDQSRFVRYEEPYLGLSSLQIQKIKILHAQHGKCSQIYRGGPYYCTHIEKYLQIINKMNHHNQKNKIALKLPIQKIGQPNYDKLTSEEFYSKKETKDSSFIKMGRSSEMNSTYLKPNLNTEQGIEERQRILPIINNTASNYYKGKSKLLR